VPRILLTSGPDDWQKMLADPEKHWRSGCPLALHSMSGVPTHLRTNTNASISCCVRSAFPRFLAAIFAISFSIALLRQSSPASNITQKRRLSSSIHSVSSGLVGGTTKLLFVSSGCRPWVTFSSASQAHKGFRCLLLG
jgi:hypothetical protein